MSRLRSAAQEFAAAARDGVVEQHGNDDCDGNRQPGIEVCLALREQDKSALAEVKARLLGLEAQGYYSHRNPPKVRRLAF